MAGRRSALEVHPIAISWSLAAGTTHLEAKLIMPHAHHGSGSQASTEVVEFVGLEWIVTPEAGLWDTADDTLELQASTIPTTSIGDMGTHTNIHNWAIRNTTKTAVGMFVQELNFSWNPAQRYGRGPLIAAPNVYISRTSAGNNTGITGKFYYRVVRVPHQTYAQLILEQATSFSA